MRVGRISSAGQPKVEPKPHWKALIVAGIGVAALGFLMFKLRGNANFCQVPEGLRPFRGVDRVRAPSLPMQIQEVRLMHPQMVFLENGNGYVMHHKELRECHLDRLQRIDRVYEELKGDSQFQQALESEKASDGKGVQIADGNFQQSLFGVSARKLQNYHKASDLIEQILKDLPHLSASKISEKLLQANEQLFEGLSVFWPKGAPGSYRTELPIVFIGIPGVQGDWMSKTTEIVRRRGSEEDVRIFQEILPIVQKNWSRKDVTLRQLQTIELLGYLPPDPDEVVPLMKDFARQFKEAAVQMESCPEFDPIAFAAWGHCRIGEIHPFIDGNGRIARLVMNAILRKAGHQPVVFPNREEYAAAALKNQKTPGSFAAYLRQQAIPWNNGQFSPSLPCLKQFTC